MKTFKMIIMDPFHIPNKTTAEMKMSLIVKLCLHFQFSFVTGKL